MPGPSRWCNPRYSFRDHDRVVIGPQTKNLRRYLAVTFVLRLFLC